MSTRSIIGTAHDNGFTGRYCHWDGSPDTRGEQLLQTYRELGSWEAVRDYAIREEVGEQGYWSSYMPPSVYDEQMVKPEQVTCDLCNGTGVRADGRFQENGPSCNGCSSTRQTANRDRADGFRTGNGNGWFTESDDCGAEWAYLLDEQGIHVLAFLRDDGSKAVGMFGSIGDGHWASCGRVAWDATKVDWSRVQCGMDLERCCHYAWVHFPEAEGVNVGTNVWLRRRPPDWDDVRAVLSLGSGLRYELNGGNTGSAQSSRDFMMDPYDRRPRYWWANARSDGLAENQHVKLRLFRRLKAGWKLEPNYRGLVPTAEGELVVEPGTVLE